MVHTVAAVLTGLESIAAGLSMGTLSAASISFAWSETSSAAVRESSEKLGEVPGSSGGLSSTGTSDSS